MQHHFMRGRNFWGLLLITAMLIGCAGIKARGVQARENDLSAAGFLIKPANTPERLAMLQRLPANKLISRVNADDVHYVYADPVVCNCLYVGNQQAYQAFQQHEQNQRLADEQRMTADSYTDAAWNWNAWGPWESSLGFRYGRGW